MTLIGRPHSHLRPTAALAALAVGTLLSVTGCSGDSASSSEDLQATLTEAKTVLDETPGVELMLEGASLPTTGTVVVSAEGRALHPDSFAGDIRVTIDGLAQTIAVVAIGDEMWAQLPLTSGFSPVDPDALGFGNPGQLIDTETGVSNLLTAGSDLKDLGEIRVDGEVLSQIESTLPGSLVGDLLTITDPSATVRAVFSINDTTGELTQAVLTGPFLAGGDQEYTLVLSNYGEQEAISDPTG